MEPEVKSGRRAAKPPRIGPEVLAAYLIRGSHRETSESFPLRGMSGYCLVGLAPEKGMLFCFSSNVAFRLPRQLHPMREAK